MAQPFERLSAFRERANELFVLVQRMALAVASANRRVDPRAVEHLHWIIGEMQKNILPVPLAGDSALPTMPVRPAGRSVQQQDFEIGPGVRPEQAGAVRRAPRESRESLADVLAYADGMSSRNRSIEPVKVGQPAPPIQPASWLDRAGRTDPPDVAGKVVLVHFWAISCFGVHGEI